MLRNLGILALAVLLCAVIAPSARADTITTFNISGTFAGGATLGGTFVLNTTTGTFLSSAITVSGYGVFSIITQQSPIAFQGFLQVSNNVDTLNLFFGDPSGSLVGYGGGPLIGDALYPNYPACSFSGGNCQIIALTAASATPSVSPVPEPTSILLLGTGVVGIFGVARRKLLG